MVVPQQQLVEGRPRHNFHYHVRSARLRFLAHIEDGYDSRMRQAARSFRLPKETLAILKLPFRGLASQRNGLYRDDAIDLGIARFVDNTHGSPTQFGEDLVSPKTFAFAIIHRCRLRFQSPVAKRPSAKRTSAAIGPLRRPTPKQTSVLCILGAAKSFT